AALNGTVPFGSRLYTYQGRPILLQNQIVLRGDAITSAQATIGDDGRPAVNIRLSGLQTLFAKMTSENIGKRMATVYVETKTSTQMVNGKPQIVQHQVETVISVATIQSALGNSFQITGLDSQRYAQNLALQLQSGAYSAPVTFIQERLVGPSLGAENIHIGILSTEIGSLAVIIFMLFYYRFFGVFADMALLLNIVFIVAVMSIIHATMSLPGIAGIVLTVGMAVDANVLINERIREELRNGMSPQASIYVGYERAFSTIVDANVTTLIVAVVLFALGSSSVKGFAVTLIIGLITSMVTSIFFTRALVNLIYGRRNIKSISIGIKNPVMK
ncbi:MAG: protein-export membrane protein SecD, partial [Gammaproteobacteria bacterium RIFOXYB2_FULL_38_6]